MDQVTAVTDALRAEAAKWGELSDEVAVVRHRVAQLVLSPGAFFVGDLTMVPHARAYDAFQAAIVTALGGAATEFDQLGGALRRIADAYDAADAIAALNLDEIYRA